MIWLDIIYGIFFLVLSLEYLFVNEIMISDKE